MMLRPFEVDILSTAADTADKPPNGSPSSLERDLPLCSGASDAASISSSPTDTANETNNNWCSHVQSLFTSCCNCFRDRTTEAARAPSPPPPPRLVELPAPAAAPTPYRVVLTKYQEPAPGPAATRPIPIPGTKEPWEEMFGPVYEF